MNNTTNRHIGMVVNIKEILWDLLEQWKAVLITALLMAILVTGAKYAKDMKDYNSAQASKEAAKQSKAPVEERVADVLAALPESERSTVMTIISQNEWIADEKEYINNSILLNSNPTNQRTLVADYYIKSAEDTDSVRNSLIYGYTSSLKDAHAAEALRAVIAPDAEINYITELIDAENSKYDNGGAESCDAILTVKIVLPEGVDAQKVTETLTSMVREHTPELSSRICPHSTELISVNEAYLYNQPAVKARTDTLTSIYNLQNNVKNMQTSLTDGQKAAIDAITEIKAADKKTADVGKVESETTDTDAKPGLSKKYAMLGFVLGVLMYAFIYLMIVIRRGCLLCASDASLYTGTRLLGELYEQTKATGIKKLFKSKVVQKYRYSSRLDTLKQTGKMSTSIEAVCRHEEIKELMIFDLSGSEKMKTAIIKEIGNLGIKVSEIATEGDVNENDLCDVADAIFLTGNTTKVSGLCGLSELLKDYGVRAHGSIYASEI